MRVHSAESCALDVVDANPDGVSRRDVANSLGLKAEQQRVAEHAALLHFEFRMAVLELHNDGECSGGWDADTATGCPWCRTD